ncbi:DUF4296 domain-containing protein [Mucilaginibacter sp. JRF]|uniref:DUF4296 domain-containing protein n=1 Tax=Mucilaginibacter sp. JRF TaxID=2780088 RepID=UPI00187DDB64|nr:DUF4296 domain-containing protein [Mucilaginibacter sp. JRF]MBE9583124.1 DUF4296 domain-containing protein [Mucilaginibacter sp. JRF]
MRKYIILFFSALAVLCSCGDNTPDGILDEKQMADVLTDVHVANGTLFMIPSMPDSLYKYGLGKYLLVFKQHNTDSAQFTRSYKYYTRDIQQLVAIYDVVSKNLQKRSDSLNKVYLKMQQKPNKPKPQNPKPPQSSDTAKLKPNKAVKDTVKKAKQKDLKPTKTISNPAKPQHDKLIKDTVKRIKRNAIPK